MNSKPNPFLGYICAIAAQVCWGCFPLYFDLLKSFDAFDIGSHRVIWAFLFLILIVSFGRLIQRWNGTNASTNEVEGNSKGEPDKLTKMGLIWISLAASILIGINWFGFVWAVSKERVLDASIGYYLCPQVVVLLGVIFLGERLSRLQWIAFCLAAFGVAWMSRSATGFPWIGLIVAVSFGLYGLVKKKTPFKTFDGLAVETGILFGPILIYMLWRYSNEIPIWGSSPHELALFVGTGALTIIPLVFFAIGVKNLPLSTAGVLQFLGPTLQFSVGVFVLGEKFDQDRAIGFAFVWMGVIIFLRGMRTNVKSEN